MAMPSSKLIGTLLEKEALVGRNEPVLAVDHEENGQRLAQPCPAPYTEVLLGMGCFWGAERKLWNTPGVWLTAVGYAGGFTPNPTYDEVCTGQTGHTEVVRVWFDPKQLSLDALLTVFWESHDPTQGMRQGNDVGSQYRSAIYVTCEQDRACAQASLARFQAQLTKQGFEQITTEIEQDVPFFLAEAYHQRYLAKNPSGYCGLKGTGVTCV